jgi:hypothetical protein
LQNFRVPKLKKQHYGDGMDDDDDDDDDDDEE